MSDADYPASALRKGEQGVTRFAVAIGPDGRVRDCAVTRSSGSPELDAVTCAKVSRRARFDPASDERGGAVAGRYANAINWRIPEERKDRIGSACQPIRHLPSHAGCIAAISRPTIALDWRGGPEVCRLHAILAAIGTLSPI